MQMFATCPVHGKVPIQGLIGGNASITLHGVRTNCPYCGRMSLIEDGAYDIVGSVVRAFRAKGVTREQVQRLKVVAEQVEAGTLSTPAATDQIAELDPAIQALWKWLNANGQAISVLLAIIALYISLQSSWSNDDAVAEQLKATQTQTELVGKQLDEQRQQGELIAEINARLHRQNPLPEMGRTATDRLVPTAPNRHERRKAARQSQRKGKPVF